MTLEFRLSPWESERSFPYPRASLSVSLDNVTGYVYLLGGYSYDGNEVTNYDKVHFAQLTPQGNLDWRETTPLPSGRSGSGSVIHNGRIYVVGGTDGNILDDVLHAQIDNGDHSVGEWTSNANRLTVPRSNIGLQVVKTSDTVYYLAAIAGVTPSGQDYDALDSVEVALINSADGTVGEWTLCPNRFQNGRSAPATFVQDNKLYVLGGLGPYVDGETTIYEDIQWAELGTEGCPEPWQSNPNSLIEPIFAHTVEVSLLLLRPIAIVLGGDKGGGEYLDEAQLAAVQQDGDIGEFEKSDERFANPRWGHGSVLYENRLYIFGGKGMGANDFFLDDVQFSDLRATIPFASAST